ncbi:MAG: M23 family metallopeptidase, partial [Treponema sp.]|nr:M23 family metallopeptidase [Treponema sp.]
ADEVIHVVGRGETIYSISRRYQVNANDLMRANNITDPSTLQAGTRLVIPQPAQNTPVVNNQPAAPASAQTLVDYRVVRGDTLYSIARNNGITLQNLLEINNFSTNHVIRVGDVIKVPGRGGASAAQNTTPVVNTTPAINSAAEGIYSLRWPITPRDITYMSGRTGVVVEGEHLESVRSLTVGNVISAGPWRKFGRVVIVEAAGGYFYMYGGCESLSVNVGDRITPGTEVGKLGVNSVTEKPQLFFMIFRNDSPIDPALAPRAAGNAKT